MSVLINAAWALGPYGTLVAFFVSAQLAFGAFWGRMRKEGRLGNSAVGRHRA